MWVDCQYAKYLLLFPKKNFLMLLKILKYIQEFPGGAADENSPANAGHVGSSHGVWEDPRSGEQRSPWTATTVALSP